MCATRGWVIRVAAYQGQSRLCVGDPGAARCDSRAASGLVGSQVQEQSDARNNAEIVDLSEDTTTIDEAVNLADEDPTETECLSGGLRVVLSMCL